MPAGDKAEVAGDVLAPDTLVGSYRVRALIGEGAMGQVYMAQDVALGRRVALKLIKHSVMQAGGLERFLEEARTTASFSHPHIVTLHAVGEHDGRPFLALEYVDGESLRARLAAGPVSVREALRIARAIAEAIAEAHRRGLVHADLKPENIVIPRDGRVRLVDFGLAKLVGTRIDTASGTPAYMAPERWRNESPTGAIDVWSLGIVLHELITGKRPVDDAAAAQLAFASTPRTVYAPIGTPWSALVADCLAVDPRARIGADELVRRIDAQLHPRAAVDGDAHCPFPGLSAFTRDDAAAYFGRRAELDAMVEHLRTSPLIPVVGPSGVGKSSFVYAALIPRLEDVGAWSSRAFRPGASPYLRLAEALDEGRAEQLAEQLRCRPETLSLVLSDLAKRVGSRLLIFIDQFEEVFTLAAGVALAFCDCIANASLEDEPWRFVVTLRDDYFGRLAEAPAMRGLLGAVCPLAPLSTADLRAAVLGPLANAGYALDPPTLADRIVRDVEAEPAPLPLLQFTCRSLWDRRDATARTIASADYLAIGGASGALATHAQHVLSRFSGTQVRLARTLLLALVHPDGTRRPRRRTELLDGLPGEAVAVLDRLLEARLIVAAREPDGDDARIELAHEALAVAWPQLARWIDESFEERLLVAELEQASQLWERRGKRDEEAWAGVALGEALRKVSEWNIRLPSSAREFLAAGQERDRRMRRRRRWLLGGSIGLLGAIAVTAALVAVAFSHQNEEARLADVNMGVLDLELAPFDWDPQRQRAVPPVSPPELTWTLHFAAADDPQSPGARYREPADLQRGTPTWREGVLVERVNARSGPAFIEVSRGGGCSPSVIFLQHLPGYSERATPPRFHLAIPTCDASRAGTVAIPAGPFVANRDAPGGGTTDEKIDLPAYRIDRTEVTRGAFAMYGAMSARTGDGAAPLRDADPGGRDAALPIVGINFFTARNYCRYLGKKLPTVEQWQKAFRGGLVIAGAQNPSETRTKPWLATTSPRPANVGLSDRTGAPAPVGSYRDDTSPYGLVDLAGNVSEWSASMAVPTALHGLRTVLGANWDEPPDLGHDDIHWRNSRPDRYLDFVIGVRCVSYPVP